MQYWKKPNFGTIERLEDGDFKKHPEKLDSLKAKGYIRVMDESDWTPYKESPAKKAVKKIKKKINKK